MERSAGIEPAYPGWRPGAWASRPRPRHFHLHVFIPSRIPTLMVVRLRLLVEQVVGFEPTTFCLASRHSTSELHLHDSLTILRGSDRIRTCGSLTSSELPTRRHQPLGHTSNVYRLLGRKRQDLNLRELFRSPLVFETSALSRTRPRFQFNRRKVRDSNPRTPFGAFRFQGGRYRPLCQPSIKLVSVLQRLSS